ncbi:DUF4232 domain-containing protein [Curtobacterium sp. MCSS17_008]|uniref:DUF4232 domain-containing protein n=1 Tax=Curtobacterium sp. MCSS17_008 TaxID=2175647 RepID=UPI000DA7579A|nr:DUF4232 domain-containing protein [Curtobacterium sp. MCSS17_008]PZF54109.1 DUF4232 domain-containing protein [Curtobacterium sp. MCSS17_008]
MHRRTRSTVALATSGLVAVLALSGCASDGEPGPGGTATETTTVTAAPPSPTPTSPASSAPAASGSGAPGSAAGGGTARCTTASLSGSIEAGSGGAAGSTIVHLALRNTGSSACTLQGWPGVSFVGGGSGTQIGAAATREEASPHPTVTLAPGAVAVAPLKVTRAENYAEDGCDPVTPDGFRVYPPGSKQSLFVRTTDFTACRSTDAGLLSVQGLVPEGQAVD